MLKPRVATAFVLLSLFLIIVFWLPTPWFAGVLGLIVFAAALEWTALAGVRSHYNRGLWLGVIAAGLVLAWVFRHWSLPMLIVVGVLWWCLVAYGLFASDRTETVGFRLLSGIILLLSTWSSLVFLHGANQRWLITLFVIVWLADIGAFFAGRRWGRYKLAPDISPGKTIEGMVGGIVMVASFGAVMAVWFEHSPSCIALMIGAFVLTALFSVVGDLWESKMKRAVGVKDSGALLPGHGGILDRIDSVTAAAPVFVLLMYGLSRAGLCVETLMFEVDF